MEKKTILKMLVLLLALMVLAAGCAKEEPVISAGEKEGGIDQDVNIVFSHYSFVSPFFVAAAYGFAQELGRLGFEGSVMDANNVLSRQIDMIDDAISKGADAIIILPMDSDALSVAVEKCNDAGIPVITIDRSITGGKVATTLQSDNVEAGRKIAREFINQFEKTGKKEINMIQIRGQLGSSPSRDRDKGFWEVMEMHPEYKINLLAQTAADWEPQPAMEATLAHLTAHPDIDAIFMEADCMASGVFAAMEQMDKVFPQGDPKHIITGGVDGVKFALDAVRKGIMDVSVSQYPDTQGRVAVLLAYHAIKYGTSELPPNLYFDTESLTPSNIEEYTALWGDLPIGGTEVPQELKKLLRR